MMTADSMLSKRPVLKITVHLIFPLELFSPHIYCTTIHFFFTSLRYESTDTMSLECMESGSWSNGVPSCDPVTCETPPSLRNAHYNDEDSLNDYKFMDLVSYSCEHGK